MPEVKKSIQIGGDTLTLSTGKLAKQSDAAVVAQFGGTVVLATVVSSKKDLDLGYFPLTVEYQERLYAGGRIKGSRWVKREGRPTDDEILSARLIDRCIRPLFPKGYKKEVQVIVTVLSVDLENNPDCLAGIAVSAALAISKIPWSGPVSLLRVGLKDKDFLVLPTTQERNSSKLDLIVSTSKDKVVMIEAGASEISEETILDGIAFAQTQGEKVIKLVNDLVSEVGLEKIKLEKDTKSAEIEKKIKKLAGEKISGLIRDMSTKKAGYEEFDELKNALLAQFEKEEISLASFVFEELFRKTGREIILQGIRPDGRDNTKIRPLSGEVGILPRTHGSAIFARGETQVLTVATLASHELEQLIESAVGEESKRFIHHYSMPPYATGETGKVGSPNRREIGHGALAERALMPVIPLEETFPYTIRVVSEIMSSNGSTSMASVCGSTLSLMDAGVPIKSPVAGIAMGLVIESDKKFVILTDITGIEDGIGDMDFKVAGTKLGVTALQLDVKTLDLTINILKEALSQAKKAREEIMEVILKTISSPRNSVSQFAPKIKILKIPIDKIGEVIGPGGKVIKKIIADSGARIDVEDDGSVHVSAIEEDAVARAISTIEGLIKEVASGEIYTGTVKRIQPFGIFVEIIPGKEGMVHVSDMSSGFVNDPNDLVKLGDSVQVRVREVDELGRINLSMNMDASLDKPRVRKENRDAGSGKNFDRRDGRNFTRNRGNFRSSGPHFPTTRLAEQQQRSRR